MLTVSISAPAVFHKVVYGTDLYQDFFENPHMSVEITYQMRTYANTNSGDRKSVNTFFD